MSPKPALGEAKIRAGRLNETPEAARMILLLQVHQLVEEHVVADRRRHLHEPVVQRNSASARAGSPARSLISDRQPRHRQPIHARERMKSRPELFARKRSQIGFKAATKVVVVTAVQGYRPLSIPDGTAPGRISAHVHRHELTPEHHGCPVGPSRRHACRAHTRPLGCDPRALTLQETRGFRARAASGNRDANHAIRPDADDVSPRGGNADEHYRRRGRIRLESRRAEKGKLELHGMEWEP